VGDSLFNRGGVAQARYCTPPTHTPLPRKTHPSWNGGGGPGVFTMASPKHSTARRLSPPTTPSCPGKINVAQALHVPYPRQRTHPSWNGGGRDRGCSPWRCPRTALQVAYPPLEKTHNLCNGGGGEGGVHIGIAQARHCPLPIPPPTPPPPLMSGIIQN
jgi:hypothetical protein